jgi:predicted RNase H-like HicB family nuclease
MGARAGAVSRFSDFDLASSAVFGRDQSGSPILYKCVKSHTHVQQEAKMSFRFYPAVLERGARGVYGVWFPDFPGAVAASRSQEEAMARAEEALSLAAEALAELGQRMPEPTPFDSILIPKSCRMVATFAVGMTLPNPSERVNVYLPRSLIERVDHCAAERGMSRSSFFGFAVSQALGVPYRLAQSPEVKVAVPRKR